MKLVVGLGNPGPKYEKTRHNIGFWIVDQLAKDVFKLRWQTKPQGWILQAKDKSALLLKPATFMNESGRAVAYFADQFSIPSPHDILVIVDDADLPVGSLRIRGEGSSGGHRGLQSIIDELGSAEFARLRVGIGRPETQSSTLREFVLESFSASEKPLLDQTLQNAQTLSQIWLEKGVKGALEQYSQWVASGVRK
jgi:PTH1 family peptidyl-tRNA hydrolase